MVRRDINREHWIQFLKLDHPKLPCPYTNFKIQNDWNETKDFNLRRRAKITMTKTGGQVTFYFHKTHNLKLAIEDRNDAVDYEELTLQQIEQKGYPVLGEALQELYFAKQVWRARYKLKYS